MVSGKRDWDNSDRRIRLPSAELEDMVSLNSWLILAWVLSLFVPCRAVQAQVPSRQTSRIRFVHAASNVDTVDVLINGARVFAKRTFKSITDYAAISTHVIRVQAWWSGEAMMNVTTSLAPRADYTLILLTTADNEASAVLLKDDNALPGEAHARLRLVHLSPSASHLSGRIDAPTADKNVAIAFRGASSYTALPAGHLSVSMGDSRASSISLESDTVYTAFVFDDKRRATLGLSIDAQGTRILLPTTGDELNKPAAPGAPQ